MPGFYTIKNYGTKDYVMHPRNFFVTEDLRGIMYIGNAYGVMEFDGNTWRNIPLTNGESAISMASGPDGKLYIGSNSETGYLYVDSVGNTRYQSFANKMPADKFSLGNIYNVFSADSGLVFWGCTKALFYKNEKFEWILPANGGKEFSYAKKIGNTVFFHQPGLGLLTFDKGKTSLIKRGELLKDINITDLLRDKDGTFLIVTDNDILSMEGNTLSALPGAPGALLRQHRLSHGLLLANGNILITTHDDGCFIFDKNGFLQKHLSSENGLQSNNINYAYEDSRGGLWLALDNGIAYIEINSAFSFIEKASGISGMGITAALYDQHIYLGTSQGLYVDNWNKKNKEDKFKPVKGISGQIWGLLQIGNTLICNQVNRLYVIKDDQATPIFTEFPDKGNWKIMMLKSHPGYAIVGTYTGFQLYHFENGTLKYIRKLQGFDEACRTFAEDNDGTIWVSHGNRGLHKLSLQEDLKTVKAENYTTKNSFKPDFFNDINFIDNQLVFASDNGPYTCDATQDKLIHNAELEKITGDGYINKFYQFKNGNIIAFKGGDVVLFRKNGSTYKAEYFLLKKISGTAVGSYEFAMPLDSTTTIIGTEQGYTLFNTNYQPDTKNSFQVLLRKTEAPFKNDSILFFGNFKTEKKDEVFEYPYTLNSLRLSYSANFYETQEKMIFQYAWVKKGSKNIEWSGWSSNTQTDLTSIREGTYEFHIRAKNVYGTISDESVYMFRILPPWYRSGSAYAVYVLLMLAALYGLLLLIRKRFKKQREQLEQKYLIDMLQKDKELIALQNEALEEKLTIQNNELASLAAVLNQKSELLSLLKERIKTFEATNAHFDPKLMKEFVQSVDQHFDIDNTWERFQLHFDKMHQNFLQRFKEKHPKLDETWLLICAYIRMNKSYKEISSLLNISVAAVDKRLYRLKEKLDLEADAKLREYIQNF